MTTGRAVALRALRPGDTAGMREVLQACERSWADFAPAGWTPPPAGAASWIRELGSSPDWTRVAASGEEIVGFASWGDARDAAFGPAIEDVANLNALFVHPDWWRRGVATRLLEEAEASMREAGYAWGRLFTPQGAPAERFYVAQGWIADGRLAWHHVLGFAVVGYAREL